MQFKNASEHAAAQKKVADADAKDAKAAYEAGFIKCCQDMGLTEAEYEQLRAKAGEPA